MNRPDPRLDLIASLLQTAAASTTTALKLFGEMRAEQVAAQEIQESRMPAMAGRKDNGK